MNAKDGCNCELGDDIIKMNKGYLRDKTQMVINRNIIGPLMFCPALDYFK